MAIVATPESSAKRRIYLDQNVFSHVARTAGDWSSNDYARTLNEVSDCGEVWVSPTHVIELILCPDLQLRRRLAEIMLALCGGRRMTRDYGTLLTHGFLAYVERGSAGSIFSLAYVEYYDTTLKQLFLAQLALMATGHDPNQEIIEKVVRLKLEGRWLRAEAGSDPHAWVLAVQRCAKELRLVPSPSRPELAAKTEAELVADILDFEARARRIDQKDRILVEKQRDLFVRAYAVGDVFEAISTTFGQLPGDLDYTFDRSHLAANWQNVVTTFGCQPLPQDLASDQHTLWMIAELARSLWRPVGGVSAARLAQEALFRDYIDRLNENDRERAERLVKEGGDLPTDSLTFDADHAALALSLAHVFVTRDQVLLNSCKTISTAWQERLDWKCQPVFTPEQLRRAIVT